MLGPHKFPTLYLQMMTPCKPPHQSMRPFDVNMLVFHVCRQKWLIWWRSIYSQPENMQDMPQQEEEVWGKVGSGALVVWWCACVRYLNCHPVTFNLPGHESQIRPKLRVPTNTYSITLCLSLLVSLRRCLLWVKWQNGGLWAEFNLELSPPKNRQLDPGQFEL